jgi:hypothetical protein
MALSHDLLTAIECNGPQCKGKVSRSQAWLASAQGGGLRRLGWVGRAGKHNPMFHVKHGVVFACCFLALQTLLEHSDLAQHL